MSVTLKKMSAEVRTQASIQPGQHNEYNIPTLSKYSIRNIWLLSAAPGPKAARNKATRAHAWQETGLSDQLISKTAAADYASRFWVQQRKKKSCLFLLKTLTLGKFILPIITGSSQTSNQDNVSVVQAVLGKCTWRHGRVLFILCRHSGLLSAD